MERLARAGNTCYIFDDKGDGRSFSNVGRLIGPVRFESVSLSLTGIQNIDVVSVLYHGCDNRCEVLFKGMAGVVNDSGIGVVSKVKKYSNYGILPLRIPYASEGVLQVLIVTKPGTVSVEALGKELGIKVWRKL